MHSFKKHPIVTLLVINVFIIIMCMAIAEFALRFFTSYAIDYYTGVSKEGHYEFPYGKILVNKDGWPDEEFNLASKKPRVGYFGDSVAYGVGAGHGYRMEDLLRKELPQYEQWVFAAAGDGIQDDTLSRIARQYKLNYVVYMMNMNDIMPLLSTVHDSSPRDNRYIVHRIKALVSHVDYLRGKSYLYNFIRTRAKYMLTRMGYEASGFEAYELFPQKNQEIIQQVSARINEAGKKLAKEGITFCVIILPYEMQVSQEAANQYRSMGIKWEDGFVDGSTQTLLKKYLKVPYIYNGLDAFKGMHPALGETFVYNKGDKIDWNHPNREGHRILYQGFLHSHSCPFLPKL